MHRSCTYVSVVSCYVEVRLTLEHMVPGETPGSTKKKYNRKGEYCNEA